jgi:predicted nucleic acid-binding protein
MPASQSTAAFVDTNIWLYAFIEADDAAKSARARHLLQSIEPIISTQVVNEVAVNLLRKAHFSEEQLRQLIEAFFEKYPIIEANKALFLSASLLRQQHSLSYWDSLIIASALQAGVSMLYSEDMQHGLKIAGQLEIVNPFV